jgi:CheY-like chemotaxis protein
MKKNDSAPVLVAEDEQTDAHILRLAFQRAGVARSLVHVTDGKEAVDYLCGNAPYSDRTVHPLPGLLLLDLKMPRMTGFDVLAWLASRPDFKHLPAIVFSSSSAEQDISKARRLGARDYFIKPHSISDYVKIVQTICTRWLSSSPDVSSPKNLSP